MDNVKLIQNFYESFARSDSGGMIDCYHEDIEFSDPAFGLLKGVEAKNMWRMLVEKGNGDIRIEAQNIVADRQKGAADWTAEYNFSRTGRKVFNRIHADFEFKDGKIYRHHDAFDFWKWSRQALGVPGFLLGWTPLMQKKMRAVAREALREYSANRAGND